MVRSCVTGRNHLRGRRGSKGSTFLAASIVVVGAMRVVAGVAAWLTVRSQLAGERIVIPGEGSRLHPRRVTGPVTAFAEANVIKRVALSATGGRTYGELPEGDPMAETAMNAALLRSSLFTSILAFGMAAAEVATGLALVALGTELRRLPRR